VLGTVRALWAAAEGAPAEHFVSIRKQIGQTIHRLRGRVEKQLHARREVEDVGPLFASLNGHAEALLPPQAPPRFPEPAVRLYDKDLAEQALRHLPLAGEFDSVEAFRAHLSARLPFNSAGVRARLASRLVNRYFPGDVLNPDLVRFAAAARGTPSLGEALFYLTCRAEGVVSSVAEQVVYPALAVGEVPRTRIADHIRSLLDGSRSVPDSAAAVVRTYEKFGIARANRTRLLVSTRLGSLPSFAYLLHLEFPAPGMYTFERLLEGPVARWLLWDRDWMVEQLYLLRDAGLLAKVSEIDRVRQLTTRYELADAVEPVLGLFQESPRETVRSRH
jgi:DNA repair protein RadC